MHIPHEISVDYMDDHINDVLNLSHRLDGLIYDSLLEPITSAYETWDDVKRYISHLQEEIVELRNEIDDLHDSIEIEIGT